MTDDPYHVLYAYTMGRPGFILQHVVDAHMAQTASKATKRIGVVFALVGLYLHVERGYSGTQVQRVHQRLGARKREWPAIALPNDRGNITPADLVAVPAGAERDAAIERWCASVWRAFAYNRATIEQLLSDDRSVQAQ